MKTAVALTAAGLSIAASPVFAPPSLTLDKVLRLSTRDGFAHACPLYSDIALTNAHVVVVDDDDEKWLGGRYQTLDGRTLGTFSTVYVGQTGDRRGTSRCCI